MGFSPNTKGRAFIAVIQIKNMQSMGLTEAQYMNPEYLAEYLIELWNNSGKGRSCAVAVCLSHEGLYHAHMALYGNTTTLKHVADILFHSHVEPQLGGKAQLQAYLLKQGKYAEKDEKILYVKDIEKIQDVKAKRSDLETIEEMLARGMTPQEILDTSFTFYKYEKMILHAYVDQKIKDAPVYQDVYVEYHMGASGTGKTYVYKQLCEEHGAENIYVLTDYDNGGSGGLDTYMKSGAPPILFIDELKGCGNGIRSDGLSYGKLLVMLNGYTRMQTHSRYANSYNLWEKVYITSIFPPEILYRNMVKEENQKDDSYAQLIRRINRIVYHYIKNGEYRIYSIDAKDYTNYQDLEDKVNLLSRSEDGFYELQDVEQMKWPFE